MLPFASFMFYATATFAPPESPANLRGGPSPVPGTSTTRPCYIEAVDDRADRNDSRHAIPEGTRRWYVFTPTDPGAKTDWFITVNGRELRALTRSSDQDGTGVLWRTECYEVE